MGKLTVLDGRLVIDYRDFFMRKRQHVINLGHITSVSSPKEYILRLLLSGGQSFDIRAIPKRLAKIRQELGREMATER